MEKNKVRVVYAICFVAALGGLMFGMDQGTINGTLEFIMKDFSFSTAKASEYASIMMYGCVIGSLLSGWISNYIGRKRTLIIASACFAIFIIIGISTNTAAVLFTARFFLGVTVGIASFAVPVYLSEIAPKEFRGGMVAFYQLMITIGILVIFITNALLTEVNASWRVMVGIIAIPALIMFVCVLFLPKSPRWLMLKNKEKEAEIVLDKVRDSSCVAMEMGEIRESLKIKKASPMQLLSKKFFLKVLLVGFVLQILNTLCGINPVMYYSTLIFNHAGVSNAAMVTIILGIVNVVTTVIAVKYVDRVGKKPIIYLGLIGMGCMLILLSASFFVIGPHSGSIVKVVLIAATICFVFFYAISLGPTCWTICSEIFPLEGRDFGFAITTATNWIFNAIAVNTSLIVMDTFGGGILFSFFAVICILGIFFVYFYVPETKGISLEKIEINLKNGVKLKNLGKE